METSTHWPSLPYDQFKPTAHLLHMCAQMLGKLKLLTPFEPHWANVCLTITARGFTTGLIAFQDKVFSIDLDLIDHQVIFQSTTGARHQFKLEKMSVADLYAKFLKSLSNIGISVTINTKPQEVPNPISFEKDTEEHDYDKQLAEAWWTILVNSQLVLQRYHALFLGKTQPIGFMWGTFDLRDVRFKNSIIATPTSGINAGYLRRNAMNADQVESGWWSGNDMYPRPAYYSFTFPEPVKIAEAKIQPSKAHWDDKLKLFILDYDDLRQSSQPEKDLFDFFESTYRVGAELAGWDPRLNGPGKPV